jgi:hypothetical protein
VWVVLALLRFRVPRVPVCPTGLAIAASRAYGEAARVSTVSQPSPSRRFTSL